MPINACFTSVHCYLIMSHSHLEINLNPKIKFMKYSLFICLIFVSFCGFSQDCKTYYYLQNNKITEVTMYNKKGNPSGKLVYTVSDFKNTTGTSSATLTTETFDKKGKSEVKSTGVVKCMKGIIMMDMKMSMPPGQTLGVTNAKTESVFIEYPFAMKIGDELKNAHMEIETETKGLQQSVTLDITGRKVTGKEKVTTPAGTWDCYVITNNTKLKIKTMGIGIPMNMELTEWFAPGFGMVKTKSKFGETVITAIR